MSSWNSVTANEEQENEIAALQAIYMVHIEHFIK
jgi:hypothetical protein